MSNDIWETATHIFEPLNEEFGFTLDVCAMPETAKCTKFYSPADDALQQPWSPELCWMNPPYSNPRPWVEKAFGEAEKGATVVALLPADTSTRWWAVFWDHDWHRLRRIGDELRFLPRRVRFVGATGSPKFGSAIVVMRPANGKRP